MNVALITEFFPSSESDITGGVESRAYHVSRIVSKNHKVVIVTSSRKGEPSYVKKKGVHIYRIGLSYPYTSTGYMLQRFSFIVLAMLYIPVLIRRHKLRVVDAYSFFAYPAGLVARLFAKRSFLTYHECWIGQWAKNTGSSLGRFLELFERVVILLARLTKIRIISVSKVTAKKLARYGLRTTAVIPNGIAMQNYNLKARTQPYSLSYVGRLVEHKRVELIIEAYAAVKKIYPKASLRIVGEGPQKAKLQTLAGTLGVEVEFMGFLPKHKDVINVIKSSKVFVHAGTVEGFGITLIESMASGTPYVCSNIPVFREITNQGKGGLLFKDSKQLIEHITRLIEDDKLYNKKKKECQELAQSYRWQEISKDILKVWQQ